MSRTAVVTGATRGIGKATACALAALGYDVAVTGRTVTESSTADVPGSLESTVAAIETLGRRGVPLVLDLLDRDALQPTAERAIGELGHVDVLVNNAIYVGPLGTSAYLEYPVEELEHRVYANVTAQLLFTQPILGHMLARGAGTVANITSAAGYAKRLSPPPNGPTLVYAVTKAAMTRFAWQLALEYGTDTLRFLSLNPGPVTTERVAADPALEFVARIGAPVDVIGEGIARIADDAASFDNGSLVEVPDFCARSRAG